jgi:hypothetical protein
MTRSVILTLHGQFSQAAAVNVGGPVLVAGWAIVASLLFCRTSRIRGRGAGRTIAISMALYGWLLAFVMIGQWALRLTTCS